MYFMGMQSLEDDIEGLMCFNVCRMVFSFTFLNWKLSCFPFVNLLKFVNGSKFDFGMFLCSSAALVIYDLFNKVVISMGEVTDLPLCISILGPLDFSPAKFLLGCLPLLS